MNKVNIEKFLTLLKKGTLNFSIDNIGMDFRGTEYRVGMRSSNAILIVEGPNDIITDIAPTDSWELNFSDPSRNVKPYFDLVIPDENGDAEIKMSNGKITLKSSEQKSNIFFCSEHLITKFDSEGPKSEGDEVFTTTITEDFTDKFALIRKIAGSFGKVYFSASEGTMNLETTDKTNPLANGMSLSIGNTEYDDVDICFDFKTINNMFTILNGDATEYKIRIGYMPRTSGGMISFVKNDNSERYYILSTREISQDN